MTSTATTFPQLDATYAVPQHKIDSIRQNGHVTLRGVCSADETEPYREVIAEEVERRKAGARGGIFNTPVAERNDTRAKAFLQMENLWEDREELRGFSLAPRFGRIAAELLGVPKVRLYHDQALFKEPGGGHTPWHQDQFYWPLETDTTITMWMPLTDMGSEMGTLVFASGTHKDGPLANIGISDHSEETYKTLCKERDLPLAISELNAGDCTWHYGWTLHKSPGNVTDRMRQIMAVIFVADGTRITEPVNEKQPGDLAKWLPGQQPGERVGSPLNPIVYEAP